jgi:hypothetical protein
MLQVSRDDDSKVCVCVCMHTCKRVYTGLIGDGVGPDGWRLGRPAPVEQRGVTRACTLPHAASVHPPFGPSGAYSVADTHTRVHLAAPSGSAVGHRPAADILGRAHAC